MKKAFLLLAALGLIASMTASAQKLSDRDILVKIYQQTNGDNWGDYYKNGWCSGEDLSKWRNVKVNAEGRVVELSLYKPKGVIPAEIGGLTELKKLTISMENRSRNNDPADCIPAAISALTKLETLSISVSQVDAKCPDLKPLTSLKKLVLAFSQNTDYPDLSAQTGLESLDLSGFHGAIPDVIYKMKNLERLCITTGKLEGGLSPDVANLKALKHLQIDHTAGFVGGVDKPDCALPLKEICSLPELELVWFRAIANKGTIPSDVGKLKKARYLVLIDLGLTGGIPKEIGNMTSVETLEIYDNPLLGGKIPKEIGKATAIRSLWLQNNGLVGGIPKEIGKLTNLESLYLAKNKLTGKIPAELAGCTKLGKGIFTDFTGNQLDPDIPEAVRNLEFFSKIKF